MAIKLNQVVLDKLKENRKEELSKKVNLSLVDDIEQELGRFEAAESDASYLAYEYGDEIIDAYDEFRSRYPLDDYVINGNVRDLEEVTEILKGYLDKLQESADELGISPNEIFYDYDELRRRVDSSETLQVEAYSKYREVIEYVGLNNFWN